MQRTIGSPLFLEFVNGTNNRLPVLVKFGDIYSITDLTFPLAKSVTGILLFGIGSKCSELEEMNSILSMDM